MKEARPPAATRMYGYYSLRNASDIQSAFQVPISPDAVCGIYPGDELAKFPEDHFVRENDAFLAACCGYVLNSRQAASETGEKDLSDCLAALAIADASISNRLYGAYLAAVFDKRARRLVLTNDLLSKQPLYYWASDGDLLFSTRFFPLAAALKRLHKPLTPDPMAIAMVANTAALWEDFTYAEEIHFLRPFRSLSASPEGVAERALDLPAFDPNADPDAAVERIDKLFREGVRLQYEKNAAASFGQLGSLSGGMDSRCVLVCAQQLGFTDDLAFTYAESNSLDMTVSQAVAQHYHIPHLFFSMNGGGFLTERDSYSACNEGQILYCGSTGLRKVISSLDTKPYGILHSGISGGEIFGDIIPAEGDGPQGMAHLTKLLNRISCPDKARADRLAGQVAAYPSFNYFRQLSDIRANTNFMLTASNDVHVASPYLYEPLYAYLMTLPIGMKGFRKLYYRWVEKYLKLPYRTTDASLPRLTGTLAERYVRQEFRNIQKSLRVKTRYDMNPYELWMRENPVLSDYIDTTFQSDISSLSGLDPALIEYLTACFSTQTARDKLCTLTVTWALQKLVG